MFRGSSSPFFPKWLAIWLLISSCICTWDFAFVLYRPLSFEHPLWSPYKDYVKVDKLYANIQDDFVFCQSIMNFVEVCLNVASLCLLLKKRYKAAAVTALVVCTMTCSKTILYHLMELSCNGCNTDQNDWGTFIMLYVLPNGVWIWVPLYACVTLGSQFASEEPAEKRRARSPSSLPQAPERTHKMRLRSSRKKKSSS
eukprot:g889.t1